MAEAVIQSWYLVVTHGLTVQNEMLHVHMPAHHHQVDLDCFRYHVCNVSHNSSI